MASDQVMSPQEQSPLLKARPPATDYMTYLTILEYNVNKDNLDLLNEILQDVQLTVNIGWDLIQVLTPLLPQSQECLRTVAKLGNPREVLLKVTESLSSIPWDHESEIEESNHEVKDNREEHQAEVNAAPLPVLQFEVLVQMLSVLHSRLKTKVPSRFTATTLQAVLRSLENCQSHKNACTTACLDLTESLNRKVRPVLPPRGSSNAGSAIPAVPKAADPEGTEDDRPSKGESELVNRLLQSFITHLVEFFVDDDYDHADDIPGMAWSARLQEYLRPKKTPSSDWYLRQFSKEGSYLQARDVLVKRFVNIAQSLAIDDRDLRCSIVAAPIQPPETGIDDIDFPKAAEDVPLATDGSLHLLIARQVALVAAGKETNPTPSIFPDHADILKALIGFNADWSFVTMFSEPVLDSILAYALLAMDKLEGLAGPDDSTVQLYLRTMSLISASTSSPSLRYAAHLITTTVLSHQESGKLVYDFILDTLKQDDCEALWTSAVGWYKDKTVAAASSASANTPLQSLFAQPDTLKAIGSYIFRAPEELYRIVVRKGPALLDYEDTLDVIQKDISFVLAGLNFYYMLFASERLRHVLEMNAYHKQRNMQAGYLEPWRKIAARLKAKATDKASHDEEFVNMELQLLSDVLDRISAVTAEGTKE